MFKNATTIISTHGSPRFLPTGAPLGESHLPHSVGGTNQFQSLLFTPYPAIPPYVVRTPHPGTMDDREHIHQELQNESQAAPTSFVDSYMLCLLFRIEVLGNLIMFSTGFLIPRKVTEVFWDISS